MNYHEAQTPLDRIRAALEAAAGVMPLGYPHSIVNKALRDDTQDVWDRLTGLEAENQRLRKAAEFCRVKLARAADAIREHDSQESARLTDAANELHEFLYPTKKG